MKRKTTKTRQNVICFIIMIATIIIIISGIGAILSTELKIIMIYLGICGLGIIIYDFAKLFLYWEIDKRDRLDQRPL